MSTRRPARSTLVGADS